MSESTPTVSIMSVRTRPEVWQPSFDDLGVPLSEVTFVVVDLETTGAGAQAAITEIGAVKVRGGHVQGEFQTLINPQDHIPAAIAVLTGITDAMVANAPGIREVLPMFLQFSTGSVLVAHNAGFDIGFLKRDSARLGYPWPGQRVVDTLALARQALLRDEVPNCKLDTLARYFHADVQPSHRALDDARATVNVLHGLFERLGNLGVTTLDDLTEFTHHVSPQRRAKRVWAQDLPDRPGVYCFYRRRQRDETSRNATDRTVMPGDQEVLYVGKSTNIRRRVASYFTASEKRARMEEMVRVATGVDAIVCETPLESEVRELRMIQAHQPRYNRRSRRQDALTWVKLTKERFPRLSLVHQVLDDGCTYWGPFNGRQDAEDACLAIQEVWPIRQCSRHISLHSSGPACALADMGRCVAPCRSADPEYPHAAREYDAVVDAVRVAIREDVRPTLDHVGQRLAQLAHHQRYEEAGLLTSRVEAYLRATVRWHRLTCLARCPQILAAELVDDCWQIHLIRYGRLAAATVARPGQSPRAIAEQAVLTAETVLRPTSGLPACSVEEAERVAAWLERPGVRLMQIDGDWSWPLHVGVDAGSLAAHSIARYLTPAT